MDTGTVLVSSLVPIAAFAMVILIIWMVHLARKHRIGEQVELQKHFLDKFSSGQELTQFLETPQGQTFLKQLKIDSDAGRPKDRILRSVKTGIVILALGGAFFALLRVESDMIYPAAILSALGIGFLISAGVLYWLSKKWDIFEEKRDAI
jgi:hypothetical protein